MQIIFGLSAHFLAAKNSPPYMHTARRTKRSFTGETQPRTSNHFSVMLFRKTRLLSRRRICIPQGARNAVLREKLSPNLKSFFGDVFFARQGFQAAAVYAYRKAQETQFYRKLSPNLKSFFGDAFSQDKASKPPLYMHTARRKERSFTGKTQPEPQIIFRRCFFARQGF